MLILSVLLCGSFVSAFAGQVNEPVSRVVDTLPAEGTTNAHYPSNKPPLLASPLIRMPVGSIRPQGWVRRQLELMADGMTGQLDEISKWCRFEGSAVGHPHGQGKFGWEELPYWLKGYVDLGYVLGDQRIIGEASKWVEAVMAEPAARRLLRRREEPREQPDLWPNMIMLYALRTYYEATGDQRVLDFLTPLLQVAIRRCRSRSFCREAGRRSAAATTSTASTGSTTAPATRGCSTWPGVCTR